MKSSNPYFFFHWNKLCSEPPANFKMGNSNWGVFVVDPEINYGEICMNTKVLPSGKRGGSNWGGFIDPLSTPVVKLSVKTRMRNHTWTHQVSAGILKFQDLKFEVWTSSDIQWRIVKSRMVVSEVCFFV